MRKFALRSALRPSRASKGILPLALLASGCAAGPDYRRPETAPPPAALTAEEQALFVRDCGCTIAQGYYFARPMDEQAFRMLLNKNST